MKKYEEYWIKSKILSDQQAISQMITIRNYANHDFHEYLPVKKTTELYDIIITVTFVFHEDNKYYRQVFLKKWLYK